MTKEQYVTYGAAAAASASALVVGVKDEKEEEEATTMMMADVRRQSSPPPTTTTTTTSTSTSTTNAKNKIAPEFALFLEGHDATNANATSKKNEEEEGEDGLVLAEEEGEVERRLREEILEKAENDFLENVKRQLVCMAVRLLLASYM